MTTTAVPVTLQGLARHGIPVPPKPVLSPTERVVFEATCVVDSAKYSPRTVAGSIWMERLVLAVARLTA